MSHTTPKTSSSNDEISQLKKSTVKRNQSFSNEKPLLSSIAKLKENAAAI